LEASGLITENTKLYRPWQNCSFHDPNVDKEAQLFCRNSHLNSYKTTTINIRYCSGSSNPLQCWHEVSC